jgi:hypothetical protein
VEARSEYKLKKIDILGSRSTHNPLDCFTSPHCTHSPLENLFGIRFSVLKYKVHTRIPSFNVCLKQHFQFLNNWNKALLLTYEISPHIIGKNFLFSTSFQFRTSWNILHFFLASQRSIMKYSPTHYTRHNSHSSQNSVKLSYCTLRDDTCEISVNINTDHSTSSFKFHNLL